MKYRVTVENCLVEVYEIEADSKRHAECIARLAIRNDTLWDDYPRLDFSGEDNWTVDTDCTSPSDAKR